MSRDQVARCYDGIVLVERTNGLDVLTSVDDRWSVEDNSGVVEMLDIDARKTAWWYIRDEKVRDG
jgi:hypothetical protein